MSDFTKEELEALIPLVSASSELFKHKCDEYYLYCNLYEKLNSMIDNHKEPCEHRWLNMAYAYYQCEKCCARKGIHE